MTKAKAEWNRRLEAALVQAAYTESLAASHEAHADALAYTTAEGGIQARRKHRALASRLRSEATEELERALCLEALPVGDEP